MPPLPFHARQSLLSLSGLTTLQWALFVSIGLHVVLLSVRFVNPEAFNRVFQDTPLEVILVNAKSNERPEKAQAIAQASLAGGGEAAQGRATSPLPRTGKMRPGDTPEPDEQRVDALKEQQTQLLSMLKKQLATLAAPLPIAPALTPADIEREQKRQQLVELLAEIEKRVNQENARPRKRYVSPATREEVYAVYYDALRRKIEDQGTVNFPTAGGKKLYGELTMVITIDHQGRVLSTEVVQPSGQGLLDRRAQAIVQALTFGNFNEAMRRRADQIVVVSRFRFTRDETLNTTLSAQ